MEYTFTGDQEDPKDRIIEQRGGVATFTMREIEKNKEYAAKVLKEIEAKRDFEKAKMVNIETNHDFVTKLSEEDLFTAHMYQESKNIVVTHEQKAEEIKEKMRVQDEDIAEMLKQLPELAPVVSPIQV